MTLSYIIPLYNGTKTICKCLDSIYSSNIAVDDFEVIVVDDCSADGSVAIVERYALSHPNLRIIRHSKNKKQGGAKNTGIREAHGKYIVFADQDDEILSETQNEVLEIARKQNADMISFQWMELRGNELRTCFTRNTTEKHYSGVSFCEEVFNPSDSLGPWSYLYRREYLLRQQHPFAENVLAEDADWIAWHLIHATEIYRAEIPIYKWIRNGESITHSTSWQFKADWVLFGLRKIEDAKQYINLSRKFSQVMHDDGVYNIESSFHTLWKIDKYKPFFEKISGNTTTRLNNMSWSAMTSFILRHPKLSCLLLSFIGPVLKTAKQIKHRK